MYVRIHSPRARGGHDVPQLELGRGREYGLPMPLIPHLVLTKVYKKTTVLTLSLVKTRRAATRGNSAAYSYSTDLSMSEI